MTKIIVMLIWMGSGGGSTTPIYGFPSMVSCQAAIPEAREQILKEFGRNRIMCLEITP